METKKGELPMSQKEKGIGKKRRWEEAYEAVKEGRYDDCPRELRRYLKSIQYAVDQVRISERNVKTLETWEHEWIYGPTGTGKSYIARKENPGAYIKDPTTLWWNNYKGEEVVIIDDFDRYQVKQAGNMKSWLDKYPFQAQVKGGQMLIRPRKIVVTSNYHPNEIWDDEVTRSAISDRVKFRLMNGPKH